MPKFGTRFYFVILFLLISVVGLLLLSVREGTTIVSASRAGSSVTVVASARNDVSLPLRTISATDTVAETVPLSISAPTPTVKMTPVTRESAAVEQTTAGTRPSAAVVESFDGLGFGFEGPQGKANLRNPSDNTLAVGPDHVVQIVNTRMAIFTKKGKRFDSTGKVLMGPVVTRSLFAGFGGQCEARNNGDAVVRFDQLAGRWLIVMPIFARGPVRPDQPRVGSSGEPAALSPPGQSDQPGQPTKLTLPTVANPADPNRAAAATAGTGPYSICYAVSVNSDPLGSYYRYEFLRPFF